MSNARDIIIRPLITEKSIRAEENQNTVVFEVKRTANKIAIKQAIEEIFNVKVDSVNVVNVKPREKRVGKYIGKTKNMKKAYITLKEGHSIKILADK